MTYTVTQYADSLDTNPERFEFDTWDEAEEWYCEEIERRVQFRVDHSPYTVSEKERGHMEEQERQLVRISS